MKKPFKDTKVGAFLSNVAPTIIDAVGSVYPPANVLKLLIKNDDKMTPEQKEEAEAILQETYFKELEYDIKNTSNARLRYKSMKELVDTVTMRVMNYNHLFLILLTGVNVLASMYLDPTILALVVQNVTMVSTQLSNERSTVINFTHGSAADKDKLNDR